MCGVDVREWRQRREREGREERRSKWVATEPRAWAVRGPAPPPVRPPHTLRLTPPHPTPSERALATLAADAASTPRTGAPFAALIPGSSAAEVALTSGLQSFLSLYNAAVVARLVLTWIPSAPPAIVTPLATIVDPALNLFRGVIPPIGGIDVSPILFFVLLDFMQNGATALPCEMPAVEGGKGKGTGGPRAVRARAGRALRLPRLGGGDK